MPGTDALNIPVAIVGGGPVGMMLALFLDQQGVRTVLFNSEETVRLHPKGSTQNARTLEHYRRLGISREVRKLGLPYDHPTDVAYFTRFNAWEIARLPMPSEAEKQRIIAASAPTHQVPEPILRANQMYVEAFLLSHVRTRANITLRFGWQVEAVRDDADGVTVEAEPIAGGAGETWRAQYLAGCDGGRSSVRRSLGVRYNGFSTMDSVFYGGRMIASHVRAPALDRDYLAHRRGWQYWVVNAEMRTVIVSLNGRDEFLIFTKVMDPDRPPDDATVADIVRRGTGVDIPVTILGHRPWTAGAALVADRFGAGRVVLAGDAVHLFTPTGGFGMNTGIDDTSNLAWKLAALVQGWGGPRLIESYEIERKPIATRNTVAARELALNLGDIPMTAVIEDGTPEGEAARRAAGAFLSTMGEEFASIGVQLGARYDGSPIVVPDGAPPADNFIQYTPSSVPGGRAPHVWLDDGRGPGSSLIDHLGAGFTLLRLGPRAPDAGALVAAARARGVPLKVLDIPRPEARDLYECDLALVRPDGHIGWRGHAIAAPDRVLARLVGAAA